MVKIKYGKGVGKREGGTPSLVLSLPSSLQVLPMNSFTRFIRSLVQNAVIYQKFLSYLWCLWVFLIVYKFNSFICEPEDHPYPNLNILVPLDILQGKPKKTKRNYFSLVNSLWLCLHLAVIMCWSPIKQYIVSNGVFLGAILHPSFEITFEIPETRLSGLQISRQSYPGWCKGKNKYKSPSTKGGLSARFLQTLSHSLFMTTAWVERWHLTSWQMRKLSPRGTCVK